LPRRVRVTRRAGLCRRVAQLHAEDYRGPLVRQVEFAAMA